MRLQSLLQRILPAVTTLVLLVTGVAVAPAHAQSALSSASPATVTPDQTVSLPVGHRDVLVSLPADVDPTVAHPLVLVFGGWGAGPEQMAFDMGMRDAADAIVAYARGVDNAWAGAPYAVTSQEEDLAYTRAVVDAIAAQHPVDYSRVYAVGHSNGGAFALTLACRAPDLVAGVVSVSGMFYEPVDTDCVGAPVPVQIIHAANDDVALLEGGWRHNAPFLPTAEMLGRWVWRNGCLTEVLPVPTAVPDAAHEAWLGCVEETELVLSYSAGHPWPSYAPYVAWDFLSRQNR